MSKYLTVKEVAHELEYSVDSVRRMIKKGAIPAIRLQQKHIRIPRKWLEDTLKQYPDFESYQQAKENERFNADINPVPVESRPVKTIHNPVTGNDYPVKDSTIEVKEDMTKRKQPVESGNTEITTSKPKVKAKTFIPNPKKRLARTKEVEPELEPSEDNSGKIDIGKLFSDYKGIGEY